MFWKIEIKVYEDKKEDFIKLEITISLMNLINGKIVDEKEYDSDISIIVVSEFHYKKDMQLDVFDILTELREMTGFDLLLLENFPHGQIDWSSYPHKDTQSLREFYGNLLEDLPTRGSKWIGGASFFGYKHRNAVQTWGVETERLCDEYKAKDNRCMELSLKKYHEGLESLTEDERKELETLQSFVKDIIVKKASEDFVDSSLEIMNKLSKKCAVFNVGDAHRTTIIERLDQLAISYKWICPQSFNNYTIPIEFYLIERKQDSFYEMKNSK